MLSASDVRLLVAWAEAADELKKLQSKAVEPGAVDLRAGKLVVRVGKGEDQTVSFNGEELEVTKVFIDIDYSRSLDGDPRVTLDIIP